ncbi:G protein alpha subunit [Marasmius tenuissimus]|nr:G protein alpha subunit [Marasmius tenuissimus]
MASGSNEASSIYSSTATETSTSTIYGLGYLSGRAIKRLGESVLDGVDYIFVNRQLRKIETHFAGERSENGTETQYMYGLLIEFTHPGYVSSVRRRAFRLVMGLIGAMKFMGLVSALVKTKSISTRYRHLSEIRDCICGLDQTSDSNIDNKTAQKSGSDSETKAYLREGRESYLLSTCSPGDQPIWDPFFIPVLLYFASISAYGENDNSRLVLSIDIIGFLQTLGVFEPTAIGPGAVAGALLLQVLQVQLQSPDDPDATQPIGVSLSTLQRVHHGCREFTASDIFDGTTWTAQTSQVQQISLHNLISRLVEIGGSSHVKTPVELILLGCATSGKSTILRQLPRVHRSLDFRSQYDPGTYITALTSDILSFLNSLAGSYDGESWTNKPISEVEELLDRVHSFDEVHRFILDHTSGFERLEALAGSELCQRLQAFNRLSELTSPGDRDAYEPLDKELLWLYTRTTGSLEKEFIINGRTYHIWDCGGQRSERKNWNHMFPQTNVVIFVVSITDYDLQLDEDMTENRMAESLMLFESICTSDWFLDAKIVLVFNKSLSLGEKLRRSPLSHQYPDYTGGEDEGLARAYIQSQFEWICSPTDVYFIDSIDLYAVNDLFQRIDNDISISLF